MNNFNIMHLRHWCQKVIPLVYDDSLSYYEVICKVTTKLNEVIDNTNNIPEYISTLLTDEKLKEITIEVFNDLQAVIAKNNEFNSETATTERHIGDLVWLKDKLYVITRNMYPGDKYVIGSNCNEITIEELLNKIREDIIDKGNDIDVIYTRLDGIDNELNEVRFFVTPEDFGAEGDGITDDTEALVNMFTTSNVKTVLLRNTYKITGDVTIPSDFTLMFGKGRFDVNRDASLVVNCNIDTGLKHIFSGNGTILLNNNTEVYPEWFGAKNDKTTDCSYAFEKAIGSIHSGTLVLQSGYHHIYLAPVPTYGYKLTRTLDVVKSEIGIKGINKAVIMCNADICLNVSGTGVTGGNLNYNDGFHMNGVCIYYTGSRKSTPTNASTLHAITLKGCLRFKVNDVEINDYGCGVWLKNNIDCYLDNVIYNSPTDGEYNIAFYVDENLDGALYANASLYLNRCACTANTTATLGIVAKGSTTADLFIKQFEMGGGYTGIAITNEPHNTERRTMLDVHITDCVLDGVVLGIEIYGNLEENSLVDIGSNWIACGNGGVAGINVANSMNVNIHNNNINGINNPLSYEGIILSTCYACCLNNNFIEGCNKGVSIVGVGDNMAVINNIFNTRKIVANAIYSYLVNVVATAGHVNISNNIHFLDPSLVFTPYIVLSGNNVINYNYTGFSNNIASGNIVDGAVV